MKKIQNVVKKLENEVGNDVDKEESKDEKKSEKCDFVGKNLRPQDKAPGLQGIHYTNILVNQLILLLFFPFVGVFVIYVQVKKCRVTTGVHSVCRVPFTNRPNHVSTY